MRALWMYRLGAFLLFDAGGLATSRKINVEQQSERIPFSCPGKVLITHPDELAF